MRRKVARFATLALFPWVASADPPTLEPGVTESSRVGSFLASAATETLPNGFRSVVLPWPTPGIVAVHTLVRVGSRDEIERGRTGFAHFFEHMMFRGTLEVPAEEYEARIAAMGADNNAFTTRDFTLYTVTAPAEALDTLLELEANRFQRLSYTEAVFQTESRAVLGEYSKGIANPALAMWEALRGLAFRVHPYGHTTLGFESDIRRMAEQFAFSRGFFRDYYTPDNTTLFIVGDVDPARVLEKVRARYAGWQGQRRTPEIPEEPEPTAPQSQHLHWASATPPRLLAAWRIPAYGRAPGDVAALQVLHELLLGRASPLYERLVVRDQKLLALGADGVELSRDPGLFVLEADLRPGTPFEEVLGSVDAELAAVAAGPIEPARLTETKSYLRYRLLLGLETPADVAVLLARFTALEGDPATLDRHLARLGAVTPEDLTRVSNQYLTPSRRSVVTLSPSPTNPSETSSPTGVAP